MMRYRCGGLIGEEPKRFCVSEGRSAPVISDVLLPEAMLQDARVPVFFPSVLYPIVMATLSRSAGINQGPG